MEYNYSNIGDRIAERRKAFGYKSQDDFIHALSQEDIHISRNTLSKLENGKLPFEKFSVPLLLAMCKILDCDAGYLLGEYNEKTRNEKIIKEEIHLSDKAIYNIKKHMFNSIKKAPVFDPFTSSLNELLSDEPLTMPITETYINALNLLLEEYPELIAYIGRIILHKELDLYTDYTQRGSLRIKKHYDIDKPLLNLVIQIKHYTETHAKIQTHQIHNVERYEYAIQFITKHMNALEKQNNALAAEIEELLRTNNDDCEFYE